MKSIKNYFLVIIVLLLAVIGAFFIYQKLNPQKLPPYLVESQGFIDGNLIHLNAKYPGRIENILKKEGDIVKKGEILAILSSREYESKKEALINQIASKEKELKLLKKEVNSTIKKAEISISLNEKKLKELIYKIDTLNNLIIQDKKDLERLKELLKDKKVAHQKVEYQELKLKKDFNTLNSLLIKRDELKDAIKLSKLDLSLAKDRVLQIKALKKGIDALKANLAGVEVILDELKIKSPINGYVEKRIALNGEVIGAGGVVMDLIDPSSFYLKVYVDTITNDKIKIGNKAKIFLDDNLDRGINAKVVYISKKAEFTPKEVAVRNDRITRVYEVWLRPVKPDNRLKLGLPAIGLILLDKNRSLPNSLRGLPIL